MVSGTAQDINLQFTFPSVNTRACGCTDILQRDAQAQHTALFSHLGRSSPVFEKNDISASKVIKHAQIQGIITIKS